MSFYNFNCLFSGITDVHFKQKGLLNISALIFTETELDLK